MSAQRDLFGAPCVPTVTDLADFIARESAYAVATDQAAPECLRTPGAASDTVRKLLAGLTPDQARDWLTRSGIKPQRARRQWREQLRHCVQREVDSKVQALLGLEAAA